MAQVIKADIIAPFSFLGLLASEGQVPSATTLPADTMILSVAVEEAARELASDITAKGDFFSLMVENDQMRAEVKRQRKHSFKIVRPVSLGGTFTAGMGRRAAV